MQLAFQLLSASFFSATIKYLQKKGTPKMLMMAKIEELQAIHNTTVSISISYSSHKGRQKHF